MDLILGRFWDAEGENLDAATLDLYESLLLENDQDLYLWVTGQAAAPEQFSEMISNISEFMRQG